MKKFLLIMAAAACGCVSSSAIGIDEEKAPTLIYCVGTQPSARGVFTLPVEGEFAPVKISGDTYIQYAFVNSGGTFTGKESLCGTALNYGSNYAYSATKDGGGDGPWSHTFYNYRDSNNQPFPFSIIATDMTFDATTGRVYGWFKRNAEGSLYGLGIYDPEAVTVTAIGEETATMVRAIATDSKGDLWGIGEGQLYRIDKTSGALTSAGTLGVASVEACQSACFDHETGMMYWGIPTGLYRVDVDAVKAEKIYNFPAGQGFSGFYIPEPESAGAVPAAVHDLQASFGVDGVGVKFTAPSATAAGKPLSGELAFELTVDGEPLDAGTIEAGATYSRTFVLAEGTHTLGVKASNAKGASTLAEISVLVGYDEPTSVGNLHAELADASGKVALTWTAPVGVNGGVPDMARISYAVVRNPGNHEVASGLTATEFTDEIPEGYWAGYFYTVSTCLDETAVAEALTSEPLMLGKPYGVPFEMTFDGAETPEELGIRIVDADNNGTWNFADGTDGNRFMQTTGGNYKNRSDYLLLPPVELKDATPYVLKFRLSNSSTFHGTQLRVFLTPDQSTDEAAFVTPYIESALDYTPDEGGQGVFADFEMEFTVAADGAYSPAFYDFGEYYTSNAVAIDDVRIEDAQNGIREVGAGLDGRESAAYTVDGRRVAAPGRGLFIITDGKSARKIFVR